MFVPSRFVLILRVSSYHVFYYDFFSPYNSRCKLLHDPRLVTPNVTPSWLEHYTKFNKKDPTLILDRLHHVRMNGVIQVNPLVEPWIWNECRPTISKAATKDENENVWNDTYHLVCNANVPIFSTLEVSSKDSSSLSYSKMVSRYHDKITDIQKLCIVAAMKKPSKIPTSMSCHDASFDFTYEPTVSCNLDIICILKLIHRLN